MRRDRCGWDEDGSTGDESEVEENMPAGLLSGHIIFMGRSHRYG